MPVCACTCDCDDGYADVYRSEWRRARKKHRCCECGEAITAGSSYEYVSALWEGRWRHYKTCLLCTRIRDDLLRGCWCHEGVREAIFDCFGFDYVTGYDQYEEDD